MKKGDKVRILVGEFKGQEGVVVFLGNTDITVLVRGNHRLYRYTEVSPLDEWQEGDVIEQSGDYLTILGRAGKAIFISGSGGSEDLDECIYTQEELEQDGYKRISDTKETIEIEGKKYTVDEIKDALKNKK